MQRDAICSCPNLLQLTITVGMSDNDADITAKTNLIGLFFFTPIVVQHIAISMFLSVLSVHTAQELHVQTSELYCTDDNSICYVDDNTFSHHRPSLPHIQADNNWS